MNFAVPGATDAVRAAPPQTPPAAPPSSFALAEASWPDVQATRAAEEPAPFAGQSSRVAVQAPEPALVEAEATATVPPTFHAVAPFRILGQSAGSYIVLEEDSGIKLIDQHALHERVLFEQLVARAEGFSRGDAQGLLIAETLELSPVQAAVFGQDSSAREVLADLGFDVEPFGPRTLAVNAVPAILKGGSATLVRDVLDALAQTDDHGARGRKPTDRAFYREKAAYVLSCKGAIKAGERLTLEQMTALITEYRKRIGAGAFTCPHGRPLALEISWSDLERAVGR